MKKYAFITVLFFGLGFININISILGLLCFLIPFLLYFNYRDKIWCKKYCPRAGLFNVLFSKVNLGLKVPKWLTRKKFKDGVVTYFTINVFFAVMSTIMVYLGRIEMFDNIRFLIIFNLPSLPQLIEYSVSNEITHFSYRIYSMMFTSTLIGLLLGFMFKPRTWCIICPISTLTTKKTKENL